MPPSADVLLSRLESTKNGVGKGLGAETKVLLDQLSHHTLLDAESLIRFHETLLFLRAFPHSARLVPRIERLLNTFHLRVDNIRKLGVDMSAFDEFDTSGISGTTMQDLLRFEA